MTSIWKLVSMSLDSALAREVLRKNFIKSFEWDELSTIGESLLLVILFRVSFYLAARAK